MEILSGMGCLSSPVAITTYNPLYKHKNSRSIKTCKIIYVFQTNGYIPSTTTKLVNVLVELSRRILISAHAYIGKHLYKDRPKRPDFIFLQVVSAFSWSKKGFNIPIFAFIFGIDRRRNDSFQKWNQTIKILANLSFLNGRWKFPAKSIWNHAFFAFPAFLQDNRRDPEKKGGYFKGGYPMTTYSTIYYIHDSKRSPQERKYICTW